MNLKAIADTDIHAQKRISPKGWKRKDGMKLFMIAIPFVILTVVFYYVPLFGWVYAFFDYKPGIKLANTEFVGLEFFKLALESRELYNVLTNTLVLSFLGIIVSPLPVVFAVMLSEAKGKFFKKFVQTTTTLPQFVSWILVFSIMFVLFSVNDGLINQVLLKLHLINNPTNLLANSDVAWYFQTAIGIWKGLGWGAIIYLAAITGIDSELYDAAKVDGAGRMSMIAHITIPGIMPTYFVLLLLTVGNMLSNGFDQYYVFYNAMVADKLNVLDYYVYRIGIAQSDYAYGTALGIFKTVISVILLFTVNWFSKRVRGQSII